ncbi:hypothetical protein C7U60_17725 [Mesorhizobium plurifarium]|nr:hypothetical protein C7U60_17725 [Mesorhizobium plurifarium]
MVDWRDLPKKLLSTQRWTSTAKTPPAVAYCALEAYRGVDTPEYRFWFGLFRKLAKRKHVGLEPCALTIWGSPISFSSSWFPSPSSAERLPFMDGNQLGFPGVNSAISGYSCPPAPASSAGNRRCVRAARPQPLPFR